MADRSIGDVLKKLPGIVVEDNGAIRYLGQLVTKMYLDGDNLLDDKYGLATKALPHKVVNNIVVLQRHQAIKALQGKAIGEELAINLELDSTQRKVTIGKLSLGAGITDVYNIDGDVISLSKRWKNITTLKVNNVGNDVTAWITEYNRPGKNANIGIQKFSPFLQAAVGRQPAIAENRYLFNNTLLFNTHALRRLSDDRIVKFNVHGFQHKVNSNYRYSRTYFLVDEDVIIDEVQNSNIINRSANASVEFEHNGHNSYLANRLAFEVIGSNSPASISGSSQSATLSNKNIFRNFSNELKWLKAINKKDVYDVVSYLSFEAMPETLVIRPYTDASSDSIVNTQELFRSQFFTNHYGTLRRNLNNNWSVLSIVGLRTSSQHLNSSLKLSGNSSDNKLLFQKTQLYINPEIRFKRNRLNIALTPSIAYERISYDDAINEIVGRKNGFLYKATVSADYKISRKYKIRMFYTERNSRAELMNLYSGSILRNYRTLYKNANYNPYTLSQFVSAKLDYEDAIKQTFATLEYSFRNNEVNFIDYTEVNSAFTTVSYNPYPNNSSNHAIRFQADKYLYYTRTNISIHADYAIFDNYTMVNSNALRNLNNRFGSSIKIEGDLLRKLRYHYSFTIEKYSFRSANTDLLSTNSLRKHLVWLRFLASEHTFFRINYNSDTNTLSSSGQNRFEFLDADVTFRLKKIKSDVSLSATNLLNNSKYQSINIMNNMLSVQQYPLRQRQYMANLTFYF